MAFILAPDHSDRTRVQLSFVALIMTRLFLLSAGEIGFWGRGAEENSAARVTPERTEAPPSAPCRASVRLSGYEGHLYH